MTCSTVPGTWHVSVPRYLDSKASLGSLCWLFEGAKVLAGPEKILHAGKLHEEAPFSVGFGRCARPSEDMLEHILLTTAWISSSEITSECEVSYGGGCSCVRGYSCPEACVNICVYGSQVLTCGTVSWVLSILAVLLLLLLLLFVVFCFQTGSRRALELSHSVRPAVASKLQGCPSLYLPSAEIPSHA